MAAATVTASGGQVRSRRRVRALPHGCWRLAVLLGLAWTALLLLGGTAHATCDDAACEQPAGPAGPEAQPEVPLVGKLLASVGDTPAASSLEQVTDLTATVLGGPERTAPIVATDAPTDTAGPTQTNPSAGKGSDAVELLADTVRGTADSVDGQLLIGGERLPSVRSTATSLVDGVARQVVRSADTAVDTVEALTVPLPLAGGLTETLRTTVGSTLDLATRVAVDTTYAATGAVDRTVGLTSSVLSPVLSPVLETVTRPADTDDTDDTDSTDGPGGSAGPGGSTGSPAASGTIASGLVLGVVAAPADAAQADQGPAARALSGPGTPPPDTNRSTTPAVQSAADTITTLAVPVSGAGSITGNGGTTSVPRLDQTPGRVEVGPTGEDRATEPVESFSGPMPGTPSADPAFSPD